MASRNQCDPGLGFAPMPGRTSLCLTTGRCSDLDLKTARPLSPRVSAIVALSPFGPLPGESPAGPGPAAAK